jgi:hypothetical protein
MDVAGGFQIRVVPRCSTPTFLGSLGGHLKTERSGFFTWPWLACFLVCDCRALRISLSLGFRPAVQLLRAGFVAAFRVAGILNPLRIEADPDRWEMGGGPAGDGQGRAGTGKDQLGTGRGTRGGRTEDQRTGGQRWTAWNGRGTCGGTSGDRRRTGGQRARERAGSRRWLWAGNGLRATEGSALPPRGPSAILLRWPDGR